MKWFARLSLSLFLLAAQQSIAGSAENEIQEFERLASYHPPQAIEAGEKRLREARSAADKPGQLKALRQLILAHAMLGDFPGVREDSERGTPLARELGDMDALCQFITANAGVEWRDGRYLQATALYDEAIALATRHNLPGRLARIYFYKAVMYNTQVRSADALALLFKGYALLEAQQDKYWMALTLSVAGNVYSKPDSPPEDLVKAVDFNKRALELLDSQVYRADASGVYNNLGLVYFRLKDFVRARQALETAVAFARAVQDPYGAAYPEYRLGKLAIEERRFDVAMTYLDNALQVFKSIPGRARMEFAVNLDRADVLLRQGRKKESLEALASAKQLLTQIASPQSDIEYYEMAAEIHSRSGDYEKAFRDMQRLRDALARRSQVANTGLVDELKVRFDVQMKEAENALLRSQEKESEARRLVLILALALSLILLGGVMSFLVYQLRQKRRFAGLAMRDDLTGLPNRRSILEFARLQTRSMAMPGGNFCVALIDIDYFKAINDDLGHAMGDAVLVAFSQACQRQLRASDQLGRFGGEEFLLIMPGSETSRVADVFARLRSAAMSLEISGLPPQRKLTFSMGATAAKGGRDNLNDMIKRADEALYRAKQAGRDRYEIG